MSQCLTKLGTAESLFSNKIDKFKASNIPLHLKLQSTIMNKQTLNERWSGDSFPSNQMMLKKQVLLFVVILFPLWGLAQKETSLQPFAETANFKLEEFSIPDSKAANTVNCIVQGPNDFLWMASHDGLHRYDGQEVITFKKAPGDTLEDPKRFNFSYVENLYWDRFDQLWVCTYGGGLYRFDPTTEDFRHFGHDPMDVTSISSDRVLCVAEDAVGDLWIGTEEGLNRFDRTAEKFERFMADPQKKGSLSHSNVRNIYLDKQGTLWIATGVVHWHPDDGGLNRYNPIDHSFTSFTYDPQDPQSLWTNAVQGMLEDSSGDFWVATTAGLQKMNRASNNFERFPYHPNQPHAPGAKHRAAPGAYSLLEDRQGGLWVGTIGEYDSPSHLLRYDPKEGTVEEFPVKSAAWHLFESKDGTIWVSDAGEGRGNVLKISPKTKAYQWHRGTHVFEDFKKTPLFNELSFGPQEDEWFGPVAMTFDTKDSSMWVSYILKAQHLKNYAPRAILLKYNPKTEASQFFHLDQLDLSGVIPLSNSIEGFKAIGMAVGKDGKIWGTFASDQVGLYSFDPQTQLAEQFRHDPENPNSLLSNQVYFLMMDSKGHLWVAQHEAGLSHFDPLADQWVHYQEEAEAPYRIGGFDPAYVMETKEGAFWTGGLSRAGKSFITRIDPAIGTTKDYEPPVNFPIYNYPRFFAKSGDELFFSLYVNGFARLSPTLPEAPSYQYNPDKNNFPLIGVASVIVDKSDNLWIGSNSDNQVVYLNPRTEKWQPFKNQLDEPFLDRSGELGPDGHLYYLHKNNGWSEVDPDALSLQAQDDFQLRLTNLYLGDRREKTGPNHILKRQMWETKHLEVKQADMPLRLSFSCFHFLSKSVVYQYRLYPHEMEWKKLYGSSNLTYSYLPTGTYQLQIKAHHENGLADQKGIELSLVIHPPWWKSWWAYSIYSLLLLLLTGLLYLYQRRRWQLQTQLQIEQEKANRLNELDQFKTQFYTNITHEFRTPLTVIQGMANKISGNDKAKGMIQRNSERLLALVNQMLDLSKLETNSLKVNWVQGDIIPYLQYLTESCHSLAQNRRLNLAFFSKEDELVMDFDEVKLQQILINLLSNAIKFTPEYGSVKVIVSKTTRGDNPHLQLVIKDTGEGIPANKIPFIFDRFYQVDNSSTHQVEGSGIGLALVKELVHLLKGSIAVKSTLNRGSTFQVLLPIHQVGAKTAGAAIGKLESRLSNEPLPPLDPQNQATDEAPKLLIIEDNADVVEYLLVCLKDDYSIMIARHGKEGITIALENIPDLIICDVMMPELNGFEVCRQLKSNRLTSHVPIILLTAKASQADKIEGLSQGADAYLTKPFNREELRVRLENLTIQSRRMRERLSGLIEKEAHEAQGESAFLFEMQQIIISNMEDEFFDTTHLCRAAAISRSQLHRKLKAVTGRSTANYIRYIRLSQARSLLKSTNLPIGEIAVKVGFKDFSHFSRSFFKEFGIHPSGTRK